MIYNRIRSILFHLGVRFESCLVTTPQTGWTTWYASHSKGRNRSLQEKAHGRSEYSFRKIILFVIRIDVRIRFSVFHLNIFVHGSCTHVNIHVNCYACCVRHGRSWVWAPNLHQCLRIHLQVCASKRLGCHADLYTVSRCHIRDESEDHTSEKACKGIHHSFETQGRCHQKSKTGVSVAPQKGLMSSKNKKKTVMNIGIIMLELRSYYFKNLYKW